MIGQNGSELWSRQLTGNPATTGGGVCMLFQTSEHFILMENPNSAAINSVTGQVIPYTESHENLPNSGNRNRYLDAVSGEKPYSPEPITPYQPFNMGG